MSLITFWLMVVSTAILTICWAFTDKVEGIYVFVPVFIWAVLFVFDVVLGVTIYKNRKKVNSRFKF